MQASSAPMPIMQHMELSQTSGSPTSQPQSPIAALVNSSSPPYGITTATTTTITTTITTTTTTTTTTAPPKGRGPTFPQPPNTKVYVVQPKDTLPGIAVKFGMQQGSLVSMNRLPNSMIFPGQQLYVNDSESVSSPAVLPIQPEPVSGETSLNPGQAAPPTQTNTSNQNSSHSTQSYGRAPSSPEMAPVAGSSLILLNDKAWYRSQADGVMEGRLVITAERFIYQSRRVNLSYPIKWMKECVLLHLREDFGLEKNNLMDNDAVTEAQYKYFRLRVSGGKVKSEEPKYHDFAVHSQIYERVFESLMMYGGFEQSVSEIFMSGEGLMDSISISAPVPLDDSARPQSFLSMLTTNLPSLPSVSQKLSTDSFESISEGASSTVPSSIGGGSEAGSNDDSHKIKSLLQRMTPSSILNSIQQGANALSHSTTQIQVSMSGSAMDPPPLMEPEGETKKRKKSVSGGSVPHKAREAGQQQTTTKLDKLKDVDLYIENTVIEDSFRAESDMDVDTNDDWDLIEGNERVEDLESSSDSIRGPHLNRNTELLSQHQIARLASKLPGRLKMADWDLVYSTFVHGITLSTLYSKMSEKPGPTLMIVRDNDGQLFGAFVTDFWHCDVSYYGTGQTFLFKLQPEFKVFEWTGANSHFQLGQPEYIAVGGGGKFGLFLDHDLLHGSSSNCKTFDNEVLSSTSDFICLGLEIWGFL